MIYFNIVLEHFVRNRTIMLLGLNLNCSLTFCGRHVQATLVNVTFLSENFFSVNMTILCIFQYIHRFCKMANLKIQIIENLRKLVRFPLLYFLANHVYFGYSVQVVDCDVRFCNNFSLQYRKKTKNVYFDTFCKRKCADRQIATHIIQSALKKSSLQLHCIFSTL